MWFGDLVTMTWWDDLWLNESFAEWASHCRNVNATRYTDAWTTFSQPAQGLGLPPGPAALDPPDRRRHGRPRCRAGELRRHHLRQGRRRRCGSSWRGSARRSSSRACATTSPSTRGATPSCATCSASWRPPAAATWRSGPGSGCRPAASTCCGRRSTSTPTARTHPSSSSRNRRRCPTGLEPILRSHRIGVGLYDLDRRAPRRARPPSRSTSPARAPPVPELAGVASARPAAAQRRRPHVRQDPPRRALVATPPSTHLGPLDDSLARALIWGAAWDMTRDAEMLHRRLPRAGAVRASPARSDIGVVQGALRQLKSAIDQFAAPGQPGRLPRPAGLDAVAAARRGGGARQRPPAGVHPRVRLRGRARTLSSTSWRGCSTAPWCGTGLAVDTDLRWSLLQRLVGRRPPRGRRDRARAGRRRHRHRPPAGSRRLAPPVPRAEAKDLAWADIVDDVDLPNAILDATIGGFVAARPGRPAAPYRDRYFDGAADASGRIARPRWRRASRCGLYPFLLVDDETIAATDAFLHGRPQLGGPPAGRRGPRRRAARPAGPRQGRPAHLTRLALR